MSHLPSLLQDLATVLGVAAGTSLLFRRLKQPAVLGYMLAGLIVGPHLPVPLAANVENVNTLAELGVIFLLFTVGLEFDLRKLLRKGPSAVVMGVMQLGFTSWLGFLAGRGLGWSVPESAFMGAALAISSTMIISKLFDEFGAKGALRDRVLSVLVVQDLFAILLLAGLGAATGESGARGLALTLGRIALFLAAMLGGGALLVPRLLRWAADQGRDETLLVAAVGTCFTGAVLAALAGCSLALGAFLAGMLASASGRVRAIERLVWPLRDLFAAIFFVAVGMELAPPALLAQVIPILLLTAVVLAGDALAVTLGGTLAGLPPAKALRTGLLLAQPGEFSFVLVSLGVASGLLRRECFPVAVGVCLLTAVLGPWLFRRGESLGARLERRLPARARFYLSVYQGWSVRLGRSTLGKGPAPVRGALGFLLLDALLLNGCIIGAWFLAHRVPAFQRPATSQALLALALTLVALLLWALYRRAGEIAGSILDPPQALPASFRKPLLASLRLTLLVVLGAPTLAILQPFLPRTPLLALLLAALTAFLALLWLQARGFPWGHGMGSQWLLKQMQASWQPPAPRAEPSPQGMLSLRIGSRCPLLGRTLSELAAADLAGATVLAMVREGAPIPPDPALKLQNGDLLAVSGSSERLEAIAALVAEV